MKNVKKKPRDEAVVEITTRGGPFRDTSPPVLRRRAEKMLRHLGMSGVELSIALVGDDEIHELNRTYRKKDKATDVLAFPVVEHVPARPGKGSRPAPETIEGLLGDVIVSIETARRQAKTHRRPLLAELTMLLAHGLLHLIGYDHRTDAEEREMTAKTGDLTAAAARRAGALPPSR
jgi:probable rRNA maturation factor